MVCTNWLTASGTGGCFAASPSNWMKESWCSREKYRVSSLMLGYSKNNVGFNSMFISFSISLLMAINWEDFSPMSIRLTSKLESLARSFTILPNFWVRYCWILAERWVDSVMVSKWWGVKVSYCCCRGPVEAETRGSGERARLVERSRFREHPE